MPRLACSTALALSLTVIGAHAQSAQEPSRRPSYTAKTELVVVDFVVTDKAGRPVKGLTAADVIVKEDGKERPIVGFDAIAEEAAPAPAVPPLAPPPHTDGSSSPSAPAPARPATVIFVDDGHLSAGQAFRLRPSLKALLKTLTERNGVIMLVAPQSNVSVAGVMPNDASVLTEAADRIVGQRVEDLGRFPISDAEAIAIERGDSRELTRVATRFSELNMSLTAKMARSLALARATEVAHDARQRRRIAYGVALLCLDWLEERTGRHSLIIVSGGFADEPGDPKYREVVTRSLRANAPIHFLDARGLRGVGRYDGVERREGLSRDADEGEFAWDHDAFGSTSLADDTGGLVVRNASDMAKGLSRILESMTTYYILAYEPPVHEKPGYRKITVEVRTKGMQVRARRGYQSGGPRYRFGEQVRN